MWWRRRSKSSIVCVIEQPSYSGAYIIRTRPGRLFSFSKMPHDFVAHPQSDSGNGRAESAIITHGVPHRIHIQKNQPGRPLAECGIDVTESLIFVAVTGVCARHVQRGRVIAVPSAMG